MDTALEEMRKVDDAEITRLWTLIEELEVKLASAMQQVAAAETQRKEEEALNKPNNELKRMLKDARRDAAQAYTKAKNSSKRTAEALAALADLREQVALNGKAASDAAGAASADSKQKGDKLAKDFAAVVAREAALSAENVSLLNQIERLKVEVSALKAEKAAAAIKAAGAAAHPSASGAQEAADGSALKRQRTTSPQEQEEQERQQKIAAAAPGTQQPAETNRAAPAAAPDIQSMFAAFKKQLEEELMPKMLDTLRKEMGASGGTGGAPAAAQPVPTARGAGAGQVAGAASVPPWVATHYGGAGANTAVTQTHPWHQQYYTANFRGE